MVIYNGNDGYRQYFSYQDPFFSGLNFNKEDFEILICHDGSNKAHCKVKNLHILFDIHTPPTFFQINHRIFRILRFLLINKSN